MQTITFPRSKTVRITIFHEKGEFLWKGISVFDARSSRRISCMSALLSWDNSWKFRILYNYTFSCHFIHLRVFVRIQLTIMNMLLRNIRKKEKSKKVKCSFNQFRIENLYYFVELERGIRISLPAEWRYVQVFSCLWFNSWSIIQNCIYL